MNFCKICMLQEFQKNRETARDVSHPNGASQTGRRLGPEADCDADEAGQAEVATG
jgi:hypothetical protein